MKLANEFNRISTAELILQQAAKDCADDETLTELLTESINRLNRAMEYIETKA